MKKKLIAAMLTIFMLIVLFPAAAIAADGTISVTVASDADHGDIGTISVTAQESFSDGTRVAERYIEGSDSATAVVPSVTYRTHVQK